MKADRAADFPSRARRFLAAFPLRPQGLAAALAILSLWALRGAGRGDARFAFALHAALVLTGAVAFFLVTLSISFVSYVARARSSAGRSAALSAASGLVIDAPPRIFIGLPSKGSSALAVVRAVLEFADGTRSAPTPLARSCKEDLFLSGRADAPPFLLGGEFDFSGLMSGRYEAARTLLRFEDPLGLFRLVRAEKAGGFSFTVFRVREREADIRGRPDKSETETVSRERTRVEGELLDIRKYVPGSDPSRRIVWKLFARTGRLMVRDAEKENVNAARLPLFVSFRADPFKGPLSEAAAGLLDAYKSLAYAVMRGLKAADFRIVYCAERRAPCLESGDAEAFAAFDRELDAVEAGMRDEVEMASHPWRPDIGVGRQVRAWSDKLRGMDAPRSRMILVTQGLDSSWAEAVAEEGRGGIAYLVRLSAEFFKRPDPRGGAERLFFVDAEERPWELDSPASRLRYGAFASLLKRREDAAIAEARARSIEVIEL
jgi:hypothetical protein